MSVLTGLDIFESDKNFEDYKNLKIGLVANQASLNKHMEPAADVFNRLLPGHLSALMGPQHGYSGEDQDNMIETSHRREKRLNIPVFSLYSETRAPTDEMISGLDVLFMDLQDVGTRVYTFASTMLNCMKKCASAKKAFVVFDRPNPLGGDIVEGNLLKPDMYSFVGTYELPMRHGMTMGELAMLFNEVFFIKCNLRVIPVKGWQRTMFWKDTGLKWHMPSTNMPCYETALVYPGQVIWEGTTVSEGRGTCRPFEIWGAPYINPAEIKELLSPKALNGCILQEYCFRPTFNKWKESLCKGFMIHVTDEKAFRSYLLSLSLLQAVLKAYPENFEWKKPPYEYEYERMPIDLIIGDRGIRKNIEDLADVFDLEREWEENLLKYDRWRRQFFLY